MTCRQTLPLGASNRYKDGHQWCRECFKAYFRERGKLHSEQIDATLPHLLMKRLSRRH